MTTEKVRVRFAPSPTGPLHIGGVRTALYNYCFARKSGGTLVLRIEDTDQNRFVPGAENYIVRSLSWCGIEFDESPQKGGPYAPYRQSERSSLYRTFVEKLLADGHAYYAFDTEEELEKIRDDYKTHGKGVFQYDQRTRSTLRNSLSLPAEVTDRLLNSGTPYVVRLRIPENSTVTLHDMIRGEVTVQTINLDDKVLFKSDGLPTYHLANVVDDHLMKITHVIRGEEWLPSAPLHVLLYRFLGLEATMPRFAHLPLILKPDGNGKLSKRDGDRLGFPVFPTQWKDPVSGENYSGYREAGYLPEAMINILAHLGWNPGTDQELFSLQELTEQFSIERVGKHGARFDPEKSRWFNHQYIQRCSLPALAEFLQPYFEKDGLSPDPEYVIKVLGLIRDRASLLPELWDHASYFFIRPTEYDQLVYHKVWQTETSAHLNKFADALDSLEVFNHDTLHELVQSFTKETGIKMGQLMNPLRLLTVGSNKGPGMMDIASVLGKEEFLARIKTGIANLNNNK
jgi:glutamyl-tRNA synthetase